MRVIIFMFCSDGALAATQMPAPMPGDLQTVVTDMQAIRQTLAETRAELERTRFLAQSAWDGMTLTQLGVLVGIALAFGIELYRKSIPWGVGVALFAFALAALAIRFLDDYLVAFMRWLLG